MIEPILRTATSADADAVRALVFGVLREYGLAPDPGATDADLDALPGTYTDDGGAFDVLADGDVVIGSVGLMPLGDGEVELRKMYLAPAWRGKGLGRRLLEHALERARGLGFRRVTLETAEVLEEAIGLYERAGFRRLEPAEREHLSCRCDQAWSLELTP